ncbi:MAG TPA: hypothetical protein PKC67_00085 [Kiritimatiellia bacterium]|mgnify:CR=1 FL=1|nr:hypothetical protein [Kiritimatiellia bacterium]HMP32718.1 hypothetical protein [Kiritimatiellia bacterium]
MAHTYDNRAKSQRCVESRVRAFEPFFAGKDPSCTGWPIEANWVIDFLYA